MKINKILTGCIAALAITGAAQATTFRVYLTGSTAFRSQTNAALVVLYGTEVAKDNAALGSASNVLFHKLNFPNPGDDTYVKCSWTGSAAGVQAVAAASSVANPIFLSFYNDAGTAFTDSAKPDIALSDVYQGSTPFNGVGTRNIGTIGSPNNVQTTYANIEGNAPQIVAVACFKFVASTGFPAGGANMTPQLAQTLFPLGAMPLSQYTGLAADAGITVNAIGRNFDSGTRITALAESGVGTSAVLNQAQATENAPGSINAYVPYPRELLLGIDTQVAGNSGYASGSTLRGFLTDVVFDGSYLVTYLGTGDAASVNAGQVAPRGNAVDMKYNGTAYSAAAVKNGQYTFWGYEHLYKRSGISPTAGTVFTQLGAQVAGTTLEPNNVKFSDMAVSRPNDGGLVN